MRYPRDGRRTSTERGSGITRRQRRPERGDASAGPAPARRPRVPAAAHPEGTAVHLSVRVAAGLAAAALLPGLAATAAAGASAPHGRSNATIVCAAECLDLSGNLL